MKNDKLKLPTGWIFEPGLLLAVLFALYIGAIYPPGSSRHFFGYLPIILVLAVPSLAGLVSRMRGWKATRLLAVATVFLYWVWVGFLGIESSRSIYGLLFLGIVLVPLFAVAVATTGLVGSRMGPGWALATVGGLWCGTIATTNALVR